MSDAVSITDQLPESLAQKGMADPINMPKIDLDRSSEEQNLKVVEVVKKNSMTITII